MNHFIDISLPLYAGMPVYPNNPEVSFETLTGTATTLTKITMGSHTGTHIDAPSHLDIAAHHVHAFELSAFIGACKVIDCTKAIEEVTIQNFESYQIQKGDRILLVTQNSQKRFDMFYDDFVALHGDAAEYLAQKQIALIGIDALSIKKRGSNDQRAHQAFLEKNIPILEGLDLSQTDPGEYMLLCLPLKCVGIDGAPARAVLAPKNFFAEPSGVL